MIAQERAQPPLRRLRCGRVQLSPSFQYLAGEPQAPGPEHEVSLRYDFMHESYTVICGCRWKRLKSGLDDAIVWLSEQLQGSGVSALSLKAMRRLAMMALWSDDASDWCSETDKRLGLFRSS